MCPDIGNQFLSIHESIGEYRLAVGVGVHGAAEDLERAEAARDKMIRRVSAPELKKIARAMGGYIVIVRSMGYEDVLEYFQTLQQGLLDGMSWDQVHVEHQSGREPIKARRRGA